MTESVIGPAVQRLTSEALEVVIIPAAGARIHRIRAFGYDMLRTPPDAAVHLREPFWWGAFQMAPWCNRIATGPVRAGRRLVHLDSNFADGSAIHGQVYVVPWDVLDEGTFAIEAGGDGWPWRYRVTADFALDAAALRIRQQVVNLSDDAMPAGIGLHPWFPRSTLVSIEAERWYPRNIDSPPDPERVAGSSDLRTMREFPAGVDGTWTAPRPAIVALHWPGTGVRATVTCDSPTLHITAAMPTDIGATAVEPQTHAPQGLRCLLHGEPGALAWLEPGAGLAHTIEMSFRFDLESDGGLLT